MGKLRHRVSGPSLGGSGNHSDLYNKHPFSVEEGALFHSQDAQ